MNLLFSFDFLFVFFFKLCSSLVQSTPLQDPENGEYLSPPDEQSLPTTHTSGPRKIFNQIKGHLSEAFKKTKTFVQKIPTMVKGWAKKFPKPKKTKQTTLSTHPNSAHHAASTGSTTSHDSKHDSWVSSYDGRDEKKNGFLDKGLVGSPEVDTNGLHMLPQVQTARKPTLSTHANSAHHTSSLRSTTAPNDKHNSRATSYDGHQNTGIMDRGPVASPEETDGLPPIRVSK